MRVVISFLLFTLLITGSSFSSKQSNDPGETIQWSPTVKLDWKDFKNTLQGNAIEAAYSVCGIYISSKPEQPNDTTVILDVYSFFSKSLSSKTTEKDLLMEAVLSHEQGHFDITEWYTRKFRKQLVETSFKSIDDFYKNVQVMYNQASADSKAIELKYDKETHHSMNVEAQTKWNKIIADGLTQYAGYTKTKLKIIVKQ